MTTFDRLADIAAETDAAAVLAAAEAWERDDEDQLSPKHAATLFMAVSRLRGPYIQRLEHEALEYHRLVGGKVTDEGQKEHLEPHQAELRRLFWVDVETIVRELREAGAKS
jgi:hypothetical protein